MLNVRVEGDLVEAEAYIAALEAGGMEVQVNLVKERERCWHIYLTTRDPRYTPPAAQGPVRATVEITRPAISSRRGRASR